MLEQMEFQVSSWLKNIGLGAFANVIQAALYLLVGLVLVRLVTNLVRKALLRSKLEKAAHSMIIGVVRVLLYVLLFISVPGRAGQEFAGSFYRFANNVVRFN